jgi:hypothetical protein
LSLLGFGCSPDGAVCSPCSPKGALVSPAAALLAEVEAAGARLKVEAGQLVASGARLPASLVERVRASKAQILTLLAPSVSGNANPTIEDASRCRHCGLPMGWPRPVGLVFGDGTAAHHGCAAQAEAERGCRQAGNAPA